MPGGLVALLSGDDLESKVGQTFLLATAEPDGWPRMALLSAGEVVAVSPAELRLALYRGTRTTRALTSTGRALLVIVHEGSTYKIQLEAQSVPDVDAGSNAVFVADVASVDEDRVGYATVEHGIGFSLVDEKAVLELWRRTTELLKEIER